MLCSLATWRDVAAIASSSVMRVYAAPFDTRDLNRGEQISLLFAWRSGAREEFEVKDDGEAVAAFGGCPKDNP
jgi:hypothetical protein